MWNSTFVKIIRWILFIPVILISLVILDIGLTYLTIRLFDFDWSFWKVIIFISFLGSVVIFLPMLFAMIISGLTVILCPNKKIGGIIYAIMALINFIYLIYNIWTIEIEFSGRIITTLIIATVVILITAFQSINISLTIAENE